MVINRIGVMSSAKLMGVMYAAIGLVFGVLYGLAMMLFGGAIMAAGGEEQAAFGGGMMLGMGLAVMVGAPIFYGIAGFIGGALSAFFYNLAAKWVGGMEIETS
jgi:hypothetical protein